MGSLDTTPQVFLIFGTGYIATQLKDLLHSQGKTVIVSKARIESREQVLNALTAHNPTRVINCAGLRGVPNADWCESHRIETVRANVLGALNLVDVCHGRGVHVTHFGSACIYTWPEGGERVPFRETDEPFYQDGWYGRSRLLSELSIRHYPNLLVLRVRNPMGADTHPNGHIGRLLKYERIIDLTGSGSVLPNLLPAAVILSENSETGIYNLTTPGEISNVEIMQLAKEYIRPEQTWQTFGLDDMLGTLKAPRALAVMDTTKLQKKLVEYGYQIKDRTEALRETFQIMKEKGL